MREPKKEIYNDVWFFYKKYLKGDGGDLYWEQMNTEAHELVQKYDNDRFSRDLISAVINELQGGCQR